MIVKGIVSKEELERIRAVLSAHGLTEGTPDEFRTWTEETEAGTAIWVEVDVHEDLGSYLSRSGFYDTGKEPEPVHEVRCPHCGNDSLDLIQLQIERPCFLFHTLERDSDGSIYAVDDVFDYEDCTDSLSSHLSCRQCIRPFDNPGIRLK